MLSLLFVLWTASCCQCDAQYVYGAGPYSVRRGPVRRSAIEALERLRMPARTYHPQVEGRVVYALPPQWKEEWLPEEQEYGAAYEYDAPRVYAHELYPQEVLSDNDYSEYPVPEPYAVPSTDLFDDIQRRSETPENDTASSSTSGPQVAKKESISGQKEEPLFRPQQNSQKSSWTGKSPIPLLKQMIQGQKTDPLTEELKNLKHKQ